MQIEPIHRGRAVALLRAPGMGARVRAYDESRSDRPAHATVAAAGYLNAVGMLRPHPHHEAPAVQAAIDGESVLVCAVRSDALGRVALLVEDPSGEVAEVFLAPADARAAAYSLLVFADDVEARS